MGFSISWVAVSSSDHNSVFNCLELSPTDERDDYFESTFSGAKHSGGWILLVGQNFDNRLVQNNVLRELSSLGTTIACSVEEHVMNSLVACWKQSKQEWLVTHDSQRGMYHLEVNGATPDYFEQITQQLICEQDKAGGERAEVDYMFDAPLALAAKLTGFKHDEECDVIDQPYPVEFQDRSNSELIVQPSKKRAWWKLW